MRYLLLLALLTSTAYAQRPFEIRPKGMPATIPPANLPLPKESAPSPLENLRTFDPLRIQISWSRDGWRLMDGYTVLKEFGKKQHEARQALRIIRDLRLTQKGSVGTAQSVMEYWLSDLRAPEGRVHGLRVFLIDLPSLRVEQLNNQWCLRDNTRVYFNFGLREADAQQSLAILKKYEFNRVALLGQAIPSMMVFLSDASDHRRIDSPTLTQRLRGRPSLGDRIREIEANEKKKKQPQPIQTLDMASSLYATPAFAPLRGTRNKLDFDTGIRRANYNSREKSRLPGLNDLTTTVPFDWRQVQLHSKAGQWWLQVGTYTLSHFGEDEVLARKALGLLHNYRFTQHCLLGHPKPHYSYFLINGQVPRRLPFGVKYVAFLPKNLKVRVEGGFWTLCDEEKTLLRLGTRKDEAYQLLQTLKLHRADRLCWIGDKPHGAFTFFCQSR